MVVAATSDSPPLVRVRGAVVATAMAEHFRAQGKDVLLVMDSVTRYAMALREATLAAGEPPLTKGTGRVYVVTSEKLGDEKSEPRIVQVGVTDGLTTEIQGGLPAGTKIVTDEIDDADKKKKGKMF